MYRATSIMFIFIAVVCACLAAADIGLVLSPEKRLIRELIREYKKQGVVGRPVTDSKQVIWVKFGLALVQILKLDEKNQVLTINAWNRLEWKDHLLTWNASKWGGVDEIRVPSTDIWKPDLVLYNYADERLAELRECHAVVKSDGNVMWIPRSIYKSTCEIDISRFPLDTQMCHLKFAPWTYDGEKVEVDFYKGKAEISLDSYMKSNEWDVLSHHAVKNKIYYPCCTAHYPDLTFTLVLRRQAAFYGMILMLPCMLLSALTMTVFWLPPESAAKLQLGINIFVAFFILLLLLAESTPSASSTVPIIGMFFLMNMLLITISTFLTVFVVQTYYRGTRRNPVPPFVRSLVLCKMARLMCMGSYVPVKNKYPTLSSLTKALPNNRLAKNTQVKMDVSNGKVTSEAFDDSPDLSPILAHQTLESNVLDIRRMLKSVLAQQENQQKITRIHDEWRAVALVLDRFFFIFYFICFVITVTTLYPRGT